MPMALRIRGSTARRTAAVAAIWLVVAGCSLLPQPMGCPAALLEGTLVRDADGGIGVLQPEVDVVYPVEWPNGWSVRDEAGVRQLVDGSGRVVGGEGDHFSAGGGFTPGPNEVFEPCGGIEITASAG